MKDYEGLTKRGQARRLRPLAEDALGQFGVTRYRLRLIKHLVNTTFALTCERGRFLLRVHRVPEHTPERISSELAWLDALSRDRDVTVQAPMKAPDGRMVVIAEAPGVPKPLSVTILSWIKGRILQREKGLREYQYLGRLLAKLHNHASGWTPPEKPKRRTYDAEGIFGAEAAYPLSGLTTDHLPRNVLKGLGEVYTRLKQIERELGRPKDQFGFIHFDLSFSNVLFTARDARPIDFDECGFGYYLGDLAVSLAGPYGYDGFQEKYESLVSGYREIRDLPGERLSQLPMFLAARASVVTLWSGYQRSNGWKGQWENHLKNYLDERRRPMRWVV